MWWRTSYREDRLTKNATLRSPILGNSSPGASSTTTISYGSHIRVGARTSSVTARDVRDGCLVCVSGAVGDPGKESDLPLDAALPGVVLVPPTHLHLS